MVIDYRRLTAQDLSQPGSNVIDEIASLMTQLSERIYTINVTNLSAMLRSPSDYLYGAFANHTMVGMASVCFFRRITGKVGSVESVVVDIGYRKQGIVTSLLEIIIATAKEEGASLLQLTSRPARRAARARYIHAGFREKDTSFFELRL